MYGRLVLVPLVLLCDGLVHSLPPSYFYVACAPTRPVRYELAGTCCYRRVCPSSPPLLTTSPFGRDQALARRSNTCEDMDAYASLARVCSYHCFIILAFSCHAIRYWIRSLSKVAAIDCLFKPLHFLVAGFSNASWTADFVMIGLRFTVSYALLHPAVFVSVYRLNFTEGK